MKVAVEGCAHGELDKIYETIGHLEERNNFKVDLLIICGDFQAVRNSSDLSCMAVPPKFRKMNTFYKYYSGEVKAPILTIFIGGNHEASNYLSELPYGGWVCPNIYYMGYANVISVGNLRIGGLSGIYKGHDYLKGHFECPPYDESTKRSAYHIRNIDVFRLKQITERIDIFISHDWPRGIHHYGNERALLQRKPFFKEDIEKNTLGSRPAEELLNKLKPSYWFAAHLHCKFAAIVKHNGEDNQQLTTKFLALDKCLPHRNFLQILDIGDEVKEPLNIKYDSEWLGILHFTNHLLSTQNNTSYMPGPGCSERWDFRVSMTEKKEIESLFNFDLTIPNNFTITAPIHNSSVARADPVQVYSNPQTVEFCRRLKLTDPIADIVSGKATSGINISKIVNKSEMNVTTMSEPSLNPDEITLDSGSDVEDSNKQSPANSSENEVDSAVKSTESVGKEFANTSTTEDFGSFFIDKVRIFDKNPPDGSPVSALQQRRQLHLQYCSTPLHSSEERMEFPELKRDHLKSEDEASPVSSCMKRFKRRNQEMYNNSDNE